VAQKIAQLLRKSINILGFQLAGELWFCLNITKKWVFMSMRLLPWRKGDDICNAHNAALNVVQCSVPWAIWLNWWKINMYSFYAVLIWNWRYEWCVIYVARFFKDTYDGKSQKLLRKNLRVWCRNWHGTRKWSKKAAIYVECFKLSLWSKPTADRCSRLLLLVADRNHRDYELIKIFGWRTIIVDDSNPVELSHLWRKNKRTFLLSVKNAHRT